VAGRWLVAGLRLLASGVLLWLAAAVLAANGMMAAMDASFDRSIVAKPLLAWPRRCTICSNFLAS
jgi:hypothetical protein